MLLQSFRIKVPLLVACSANGPMCVSQQAGSQQGRSLNPLLLNVKEQSGLVPGLSSELGFVGRAEPGPGVCQTAVTHTHPPGASPALQAISSDWLILENITSSLETKQGFLQGLKPIIIVQSYYTIENCRMLFNIDIRQTFVLPHLCLNKLYSK